jgi:predicted metal-dependent hydrolase
MESASLQPEHSISYGQRIISFVLKFTARKTLAITVNPDLSVLVTAPQGKEIDAIKAKVKKRANWILKQQEYFKTFLPTTPPRQFVSGETHYYLGKQYRLKVTESNEENIKLKNGYIIISVQNKSDPIQVKSVFEKWLISRGQMHFQKSLEKCLEKFKRYEMQAPKIQIRKMSKRWGSFGRRGVVYLNPELIKSPSYCIDYVITHELCHLIFPNHSRQFYELLGRIMPDWEQRKLKLEKINIGLYIK